MSLLLLLLPALASAQFLPRTAPSGGACALASSSLAFASSFRATTTLDTVPAFQCDAVTGMCVKFGPGTKTSCGTNAAGEVVCGLVADGTGVWRFYGTVHTSAFNATSATIANQLTVTTVIDLGTNGFIRNQNTGKPVVLDGVAGAQTKCKTTLPTCTSALEFTNTPICGSGGTLSKDCVCVTDGTTPHWRNRLNPAAGAGTSTTCPAT